jgi:hypothetical protein
MSEKKDINVEVAEGSLDKMIFISILIREEDKMLAFYKLLK